VVVVHAFLPLTIYIACLLKTAGNESHSYSPTLHSQKFTPKTRTTLCHFQRHSIRMVMTCVTTKSFSLFKLQSKSIHSSICRHNSEAEAPTYFYISKRKFARTRCSVHCVNIFASRIVKLASLPVCPIYSSHVRSHSVSAKIINLANDIWHHLSINRDGIKNVFWI